MISSLANRGRYSNLGDASNQVAPLRTVGAAASGAAPTVFGRRTLAQYGTRSGTRQQRDYNNG